jgi:hypothetical protein
LGWFASTIGDVVKSPTYVVVYKDSENSPRELYFGVFISESIAEFFKASLPMPLQGGYARIKLMQSFSAHDGHTVTQIILRDRVDA